MSYDNTGGLGGHLETRRVIEQQVPDTPSAETGLRWLMSSDVCKHCTHAGCLDVCPTGAILRTEFGTVVVQEDVCNGCGYCIVACPFGVIGQRQHDGRAFKCTMCYDRLRGGLEPACAHACPTKSIQFGPRRAADPCERTRRRAARVANRRPGSTEMTTTTASAVPRVLPPARRTRGVRAAAGSGRAGADSRAPGLRRWPRPARSSRVLCSCSRDDGDDRRRGPLLLRAPDRQVASVGTGDTGLLLLGWPGGGLVVARGRCRRARRSTAERDGAHDRARRDLCRKRCTGGGSRPAETAPTACCASSSPARP